MNRVPFPDSGTQSRRDRLGCRKIRIQLRYFRPEFDALRNTDKHPKNKRRRFMCCRNRETNIELRARSTHYNVYIARRFSKPYHRYVRENTCGRACHDQLSTTIYLNRTGRVSWNVYVHRRRQNWCRLTCALSALDGLKRAELMSSHTPPPYARMARCEEIVANGKPRTSLGLRASRRHNNGNRLEGHSIIGAVLSCLIRRNNCTDINLLRIPGTCHYYQQSALLCSWSYVYVRATIERPCKRTQRRRDGRMWWRY